MLAFREGGEKMNEREQLKIAQIMERAYDFHLSKYQYLFLTQMAIQMNELKYEERKENIEVIAAKVSNQMPSLCKADVRLRHKNIVPTGAARSIQNLEEELHVADISDEMLRGDVLENVLDYLLDD